MTHNNAITGDIPTYARLHLSLLLFLEVVALLSRRLYDIKDRLALTFEIKSTAAISEIGVVGNEVVSAVATA